MKTQTTANKPLHPLIWVAGVALILFSAVGIGAFMGWIPASMAGSDDKTLLEPQAANTDSAAPTKAHATSRHTAPVQKVSPASVKCNECGVIESVQAVETKGEGSGLGAVGGGVVGGLLGNQVGGGRGKDVMTVVGVVGGAMAGNEVEKRSKSTTSYDITVRFDDGSSRTINETDAPPWHTGDKVKVVYGAIQFAN
ncbi:MAG: glycine zipper 2TM domain-containing protein [Georgfuchsia sp.]